MRSRAHVSEQTIQASPSRPSASGRKPVRIARGDQPVLRQQRERIGAANLRDRLDQRLFDRCRLRPGVEVQDDFGVAAGLKDRAVADELVAQLAAR